MLEPQTLSDLWQAGRAAWSELPLSRPVFERHLTGFPPQDQAPAVERAGDLYLACACAHGVPGAIEAFETHLLVHVSSALLRVDPASPLVAEVRQQVREKLFVPLTGPAKISRYAGRGPLVNWLRVIALRTALDLHLEGHRNLPEDDVGALAPSPGENPEIDYIRARCSAEFKDAFREALLFLAPEQRNILRMHLIDGLDIDKIGALFGIHRATVARRLASARALLSRETQRLLRQRLHLNTAEFESLVGFLREHLDLSLPGLLADSTG